jgi:hypothetical protein
MEQFQDSMEWDSMEVQMDPEVEIFPDGARGRLQRQLWNLFEYPNSSIGAKIIGKSKLKGTVPEEYLRDFFTIPLSLLITEHTLLETANKLKCR